MPDDLVLDHIVLAAPDLAATVAEFAERTGVTPVRGGSHAGRGTANHLVGVGRGAYLEIIGPDPDQPAPPQGRWFGIDALSGPRIVTWAVRTPDIDAVVRSARARGYDPGEPEAMSRTTPDGEVLRWRLTATTLGTGYDGVVPFLIDWGTTPHPTSRGLPEAPLLDLRATHPRPDLVREALAALGAALDVRAGDAGFAAVLDCLRSPVTFS